MEEGPAADFGGLLRRLRAGAGLTQEELAGAAGLSCRSVSDLERGVNLTARNETARLLAGALSLEGPERAAFLAAAGGRVPAAVAPGAGDAASSSGPAAATRTLPRDIAGFTGRGAELGRLIAVLDDTAPGGGVVGIHAIGGMAGIGKTTLAVHAAHRLAGRFPDGQIFLPLHAHTPGQPLVDPADALEGLLLAAGITARQIPAGLDARAGRWRDYLSGKKILLVLDDAAGHEQIRPLLPGTAGSLVLVTSRRRLAALEDASVISLDTLAPGEATALLARLAGRPELDTDGGPAAEIARLCGYLPLAIGMLARQLHHHPAWTAAGLAADLAAARDRLELMHAENVSVAAAFNLSYQDLTAGQRRLFRALGLHPGTDIDAYAAAALTRTGLATARRYLECLYGQHLITEPATGRYRLHDLIREHARALASAADAGWRQAAAGRLLDYYLHTALAASGHIGPRYIAAGPRPTVRPPGCAPPVSTLRQAFEWLDTERANLHAAVSYAEASGHPRHAVAIPAAMASFLAARCHRDQGLVLHQQALAAARRAGDRPGQARALIDLCAFQGMTTDHRAGAATAQQALDLFRELGDRAGQAGALHCLGMLHRRAGDLPAAATSQQQALSLFRDVGHQLGLAVVLNELATVQSDTGDCPAAADSLRQALDIFRDLGHQPGQGDALAILGRVHRMAGDLPAAAAAQQQAQALYRDLGDQYNFAITLHELAIVDRLTGDHGSAAASQQQALSMFRDLGDRPCQAIVLNELGILHRVTGNYPAAADSHQHALRLYRDLGDRYGQAEALNGLGETLCRSSASHAALHHTQALAIARDLGIPQEEARALEGISHCHMHDGDLIESTAHLQQALAIYQRIGAPDAQRIQETLTTTPPGTA